jgi:hypothetical protein
VAKVGTSKAGGTVSQLGCDTSVACHGRPLKKKKNYQSRLRNIPEERISHLHRGGSLKSRVDVHMERQIYTAFSTTVSGRGSCEIHPENEVRIC